MIMLHRSEFIATHPDVRTGMTAYTIDGEKLGTVERIDEDNITIEKGWFFHKDFVISYDDIQDVREDQIILRHRRADFEERRVEDLEESRESGLTGGRAEMEDYRLGRGEGMSGYGVSREREEEVGESGRARFEEEARIPLREEELEARKREREGEVRIHKEVHTETEHFEVPLQKEEVRVERVPAEEVRGEELGERAFREEDIRIPITEEEVEVTKRPVVKEELRVQKEKRTEQRDVTGEVRKEDVKIEQSKPTEKK
jgi:uncharacterized protein (TIGR02271 family)